MVDRLWQRRMTWFSRLPTGFSTSAQNNRLAGKRTRHAHFWPCCGSLLIVPHRQLPYGMLTVSKDWSCDRILISNYSYSYSSPTFQVLIGIGFERYIFLEWLYRNHGSTVKQEQVNTLEPSRSLFALTLTAMCRNPRDFYGHDILGMIVEQTNWSWNIIIRLLYFSIR